jgi:hypothetical protein
VDFFTIPPPGKTEGPFDQQEHIPRAIFVGIFFLFILSGLLMGLFARPARLAVRALAFCHFLAIGAMMNQMYLGFPTEQIAEGLNTPLKRNTGPRVILGLGAAPASRTAEVQRTLILWIALIVTSLPPTLLAAGWLRPIVFRRLRPVPSEHC